MSRYIKELKKQSLFLEERVYFLELEKSIFIELETPIF